MNQKTLLPVILGTLLIAFVGVILVLSSSQTKKDGGETIVPTTVPGQTKAVPTFPPSEPSSARILPTGPITTASAQAKTVKPAQLFKVEIGPSQFSPSTVTVAKGDVITWTNKSGKTQKIIGSSWRSGNLAPNEAFSQQFDFAATYTYYSEVDPQMTGKVIAE